MARLPPRSPCSGSIGSATPAGSSCSSTSTSRTGLYDPPARFAGSATPYDGTIAYADELVGRLIAHLKQLGIYDRATIVLLSDHGEGLGDHGEQEHGLFLYDETLHVPLIVKLPHRRDAGRRVARPVGHVDVVPTLLDVVGLPRPAALAGESLRPAMDGTSSPAGDGRGVYSESLYALYHFGWSPLYALTDDRYRYIRAPRPELYNLAADRGERTNVAADRPQTAAAMRGALDAIVQPPHQPQAVSAADLDRLRALGYVGMTSALPQAASAARLADPKDQVAVLERYRSGVELRSDGRYAEAAAAFRLVLAESPGMSDAWVELSQALTREGDLSGAAEALSHAVALDPTSGERTAALASAELRLGRLDAAERAAQSAVQQAPALAHEVLARIALARGRVADALREAKLAQQADPSLPLPLFIEGVDLYDRGRFEEALARFRRADDELGRRHLTLNELHTYMGDALARLGAYPQAEQAFQTELAQFPDSERARIGLALVYGAQGRPDASARTLEAWLAPGSPPDRYLTVARTLAIVGNQQAAQTVAARGARLFPGNAALRGLAAR